MNKNAKSHYLLKGVNAVLLTVACLSISNALSAEWSVHGFAAQGVSKAANSNFINDDGKTSLNLTELGVNASYQFSPSIRLAGQAVYLNGGNRYEEGARIDYLLLDWTVATDFDSQLNLYIGRYKNQHWLYSSTRDVPHTRPSIILPQSVYYDIFRDVALGSDGIALAYTTMTDIGEIDLLWSYGKSPISDSASELLVSKYAQGDVNQDFTHQASIYYRPKSSAWQFGASVLDSDFNYTASSMEPFINADATSQRVMFNMLYSGQKWEFAAELLQERFLFNGFLSPDTHPDKKGQGFYLQSRYFVDDKWSVLARYDRFDTDKNDRKGHKLNAESGGYIPSYFGYIYDTTLGVKYRVANNWQIQAEYHWIEGRARLSPAIIPDLQVNNDKNWNMWAVQLMYWF
ncbi:hypothetical protein AAD001_10065 [Colwelliaceae bacterium 6471]